MNPEHVVALIAAVLQVRNAVILNGIKDTAQRNAVSEQLGDTVEEARELVQQVVADTPAIPEAPNTKGAGVSSRIVPVDD